MATEYWLRMKRRTAEGETLWEARCDLLPDVAGFGDTADEAYEAACIAIDGLLADRFSNCQPLRKMELHPELFDGSPSEDA